MKKKRRTGGNNGKVNPSVTPRSVVNAGAAEGVPIDQEAIEQDGETVVHVYVVFYFVPAPKHQPQNFGFGREIMQSAIEIKTLPDFIFFELVCKQSIQAGLPKGFSRSVPVFTAPPYYLGPMTLNELKALREAGESA